MEEIDTQKVAEEFRRLFKNFNPLCIETEAKVNSISSVNPKFQSSLH